MSCYKICSKTNGFFNSLDPQCLKFIFLKLKQLTVLNGLLLCVSCISIFRAKGNLLCTAVPITEL